MKFTVVFVKMIHDKILGNVGLEKYTYLESKSGQSVKGCCEEKGIEDIRFVFRGWPELLELTAKE